MFSKRILCVIMRNYKTLKPITDICHDNPTDFQPKQVVCPWQESDRNDENKRDENGGHSYERWKKLTLLVCLPTIAIFSIATFGFSSHKHERYEYVPYEYLNIRTNPFPWGDGNRSLFHNPRVNALPGGYEEEDDE